MRNKLEKEQPHYIEQIDSGYLSNFPGISVTNALVRTNNHRKIPIVVINIKKIKPLDFVEDV